MIKSLLLDFYGTLVHEDDDIIDNICNIILSSLNSKISKAFIAKYWWNKFKLYFENSYGDNYKTQRELEILSIRDTLAYFNSNENPGYLSNILFEHWKKPGLFNDTNEFISKLNIPFALISNIDNADLYEAINYHKIKVNDIITSEDSRSYKPGREIFDYALNKLNLKPAEVILIGDSLAIDITGANNYKIKSVWLNRYNKENQTNAIPDYIVSNLNEIIEKRILN